MGSEGAMVQLSARLDRDLLDALFLEFLRRLLAADQQVDGGSQ